jgi:DNA helicase-2/ATP-dependent DNA helicase PcrA
VATFHAAKGLEWRAVHVAGLEDGLVPSARATSESARAEEQRLLHVALSRATEQLTCSWTRQRQWSGKRQERRPSPHLEAVDLCCRRLARRARPVSPPERHELLTSSPTPPPTPGGAEGAAAEEATVAAMAILLAWRRRWARGVSAPEVAVLTDETLRAVARQRPVSPADLAAIPGVGPARASRLGPSLLAALAGAGARAG